MALTGLPRFRCLPQQAGQHRTTIHLLPEEEHVLAALTAGFADAQAGRLPDFPAIEWRVLANLVCLGILYHKCSDKCLALRMPRPAPCQTASH